MNIEEFRNYCLSKKATSEAMPFDDKVLVFKVMDKIFALTDIETFDSINLKCEPEKALELRAEYAEVIPGYHMNKKHWNTVELSPNISDDLLKTWIDHSYERVVATLPKKQREALLNS